MRDLIPGLLERADLALSSCHGLLEPSLVSPMVTSIATVRARLSYPDDVAVVALAGGTGSGKSSVFNALLGEEVSDVGGVRPTTSIPLAALPAHRADAMSGYLDQIGIVRRVTHPGERICLVDLPDTDSVETDHRHRVDALLGLVDLVIWVVDPEKYRDARLHHEYLVPMAPYSGQFLFALNQIDRIRADEAEEVLVDLESALLEDGVTEPVVVGVAANPSSGPPTGVEELRAAIDDRLGSGAAVYGKLLIDVETTARSLVEETGGGVDFDWRAAKAAREAAELITTGDEAAATDRLVDLLDAVAAEVGGATADQIADLGASVPAHVLRITSSVQRSEPRSRWLRRLRVDSQPGVDLSMVRSGIDEAVIRPARALLARRAVAVASVADLALEVSRIRAMTGR